MTLARLTTYVQEEGCPAEGTTTTKHTEALTRTTQSITMIQKESAVQEAVQGKLSLESQRPPGDKHEGPEGHRESPTHTHWLQRHAIPRRTKTDTPGPYAL